MSSALGDRDLRREGIPHYVLWAFFGCWRWCHFELTRLDWGGQQQVILAALETRGQGQVATEKAAARRLAVLAENSDFTHLLDIDPHLYP